MSDADRAAQKAANRVADGRVARGAARARERRDRREAAYDARIRAELSKPVPNQLELGEDGTCPCGCDG